MEATVKDKFMAFFKAECDARRIPQSEMPQVGQSMTTRTIEAISAAMRQSPTLFTPDAVCKWLGVNANTLRHRINALK